MRVRRPFLAVVLSAGLAGLASTSPASADSTVVVGRFVDMAATDAGFLVTSCTVPGDQDAGNPPDPDIRRGPDPVPSGARAWHYPGAVTGVAVGPYRSVGSMEDLSFARVQVHPDPSETATGVMVAGVADGNQEWHGLSSVTIPSGSGWTTEAISTGDTNYSWKRYDDGVPTSNTFTGSVFDMIDHTGNLDTPGYVGIAFGCNAKGFSMDEAQIGDSDDVMTYDFEAPATTTSIHARRSTIVADDRVKLTGTLKYAGDHTPVNGIFLDLQARLKGTKKWTTVGHRSQIKDGGSVQPASMRVHPKRQTAYRWIYPEHDALLGSRSRAVTIKCTPASR
jgi:hypothetical protein